MLQVLMSKDFRWGVSKADAAYSAVRECFVLTVQLGADFSGRGIGLASSDLKNPAFVIHVWPFLF